MASGFKVAQGYLEVDVDYATLDAGIAGIEARLNAIRNLAIDAKLPTAAIDAAIADITAKLATLKLKTLAIGGIDQTELNASLLEIQDKLSAFAASHGLDIRTTGISAAIAKLMALRVATDVATGTGGGGGGGGTGFLGLTGAIFGFGGVLAALNAKIPLFGGLLSGIPLVRTVGGLHLLADTVLEIAAEIIPAGIALAAFGVAASSTVNDIIRQEQAYLTITKALNAQFPGLNKGLQTFTDSVKPEVYTLFGEALLTINNHTKTFQTLATGAGQVLDNLGARAALALGSTGLEGFVSKGVGDLQTLGNIIGNVFGIFGNVLKVLPGYAQLLFGALQNVTGALEAITGSSFVQGLLGIGLALHGAVLWGGLAVTAIMMLQGPLMAVVGWVGGAINALVKFGVMFSIIAAEEGILAAATAALGAAFDFLTSNPFVWVAIAVGALVGLVVWLDNTKSAAQQAYGALEQQLGAATTFTQANTILTQGIKATNDQLSQAPKYITETTMGMHGQVSQMTVLNPAWQGLTQNTSAYSAQQNTLTTRMAALNKITGSQATTLSDLNSLGIKAGSIATESAAAFANQKEQILALATATTQLAGFQQGQAAAAQNALTNSYMQETVPAIQKVTQAETNLMNVITGGQTTFDTFELNLASMGTNLSAAEKATGTATHTYDGLRSAVSTAGAAMAGTSQASYTLNQAFYGEITAAQGTISALMAQSISQKDLTKVVATSMEQMLQYAGSNTAARSTMVDLINNALGPGTVTLKSLNQWIGTNSTSLGNMNNIIGQSTIKAGGLNSVLSTTLSSMEAIATLQSHGGQQAWNTFATDVETGNTKSAAFKKATQDVMAQLLIQSNNSLPAAQRAFINYAEQGLGLTKTQADNLWKQDLPGLQKEIDSLHGKNVNVGVTATAQGTLNAISHLPGASPTDSALVFTGSPAAAAAGMKVVGGTPGKDSVLLAAMPGEVVVPVPLVEAGAIDHLKGMIPGFAAGGMVNLDGPGQWSATQEGSWGTSTVNAWAQATKSAFNKAAAIAAQVANVGSGVARWTSLVDKALAMESMPLTLASKVLAQMQTESGGNPNAINLTDINAQMGDPSRGLLQVIMSTFDMYHWPGTSMNIYDPLANIAAAINYAKAVYGPSLSDQYGGMGSGHGYYAGGFMPAGQWGYVGENGPEVATSIPGGGTRITPLGGGDLGSRLDTLISLTQTLISTTAAVPNSIGRNVGSAMSSGGPRATVQMRYGRRGA
jgi:hypothetical protein